MHDHLSLGWPGVELILSPFNFTQMDVDDPAATMGHELTKGIQNTSARAGFIKVGTGEGHFSHSLLCKTSALAVDYLCFDESVERKLDDS